MSVTFHIPTALRAFTDGKREVTAEGSTVGEALSNFAASYPDIRPHLYEDGGELRSFINVFLGDTNVKNLDGLSTPLRGGEVITLVPAIAGGAS
ncbi:MAG: MoaD/ThiS family protein [Synergistaceae bacterium]|jgi:adenylyltransferase/sulfurtransferase|nr:MoaD/ThiS family protein [Synergistaceae bacterium]